MNSCYSYSTILMRFTIFCLYHRDPQIKMKFFALTWFTLTILTLNIRLNSTADDDGRGKQKFPYHYGKIPVQFESEVSLRRNHWYEEYDRKLADIFDRMNGDLKKIKAEWIRTNPEWKNVRSETLRKHVNKLIDQGLIKVDKNMLKNWKERKHYWSEKDMKSLMHIWYDEYKGNIKRDYPIILEKWSQQCGKPHNLDSVKLYNKVNKILKDGYIVCPEQHGGVPIRIDLTTREKRNVDERMREHHLQEISSLESHLPSQSYNQHPVPQNLSDSALHHSYSDYGEYYPEQHQEYGGHGFHHDPSLAYDHPIDPETQVNEYHTGYWGNTSQVSFPNSSYSYGHYANGSDFHSEQYPTTYWGNTSQASFSNPSHSHSNYVNGSDFYPEQFQNQEYHFHESALHPNQTWHDATQSSYSSFYHDLPSSDYHPPPYGPSSSTNNVFHSDWHNPHHPGNSSDHP